MFISNTFIQFLYPPFLWNLLTVSSQQHKGNVRISAKESGTGLLLKNLTLIHASVNFWVTLLHTCNFYRIVMMKHYECLVQLYILCYKHSAGLACYTNYWIFKYITCSRVIMRWFSGVTLYRVTVMSTGSGSGQTMMPRNGLLIPGCHGIG